MFLLYQIDFKQRDAVDKALEYLIDDNIAQSVPPGEITSSDKFPIRPHFLLYRSARDRVQEKLKDDTELKRISAWKACYFCVQIIKKRDRSNDPLPETQSFGRLMLPHVKACFGLADILDKSSLRYIQWQVLGKLCMTQGANDDAIGCFDLALQSSVTMDEIERIQTTLLLASLYYQKKNLKECRRLLAGIDMKGVKAKDPNLEFRVQLAKAAGSASEGDLENAKEAYKILEKEYTSEYPMDYNLVLAVHRLADTLKALGKLGESQALYRRAFTSCKMLMGENNPITLEVAEELAHLHQLRGAYSSAKELYELCIRTKTAALGLDHPSTAASIARLATLFDLQSNFEKADEKYEEALRIFNASLGKYHPLVVTTLEDHALSYRMRSRHAKEKKQRDDALELAKALYEKVIKIKTSAKSKHLYSKEDIESSKAKLAEVKESEEYYTFNDVISVNPIASDAKTISSMAHGKDS